MVKKKFLSEYLDKTIYDKIDEKKLKIKEYESKKGHYYLDYDCIDEGDCKIALAIAELMYNEKFEEELNERIKMSKMRK